MPSQIFEIHELVEAICDAVLTYHDNNECGHFGLELDEEYPYPCRKTLYALSRVDKFIGVWREPKNGFKAFFNVFPDDYIFNQAEGSWKLCFNKTSEQPPTTMDFERFIMHSESVRYLKIEQWPPASFESTYRSLFPTRPWFPQLRSLICDIIPKDGIYLLHPGHESSFISPRAELTSRTIQDRTPNLVYFRVDMIPEPWRNTYSTERATGPPFQKSVDCILHKWTHLRHLELVRLLPDFPAVFKAVSHLYHLQYLKMVIARVDSDKAPTIIGIEPAKGVRHSASKLEIEGDIGDLHLGLALCSPGTRLTNISLLFYLNGIWRYRDRQDFFLLPRNISLVPITEVTVNVWDNGEDCPNNPPRWQLPPSAFRPILSSRLPLVKLEVRLQCCVAITPRLLDVFSRSSPHLEHFVILRSVTQVDRSFYFPTVTLGDALHFALALPKLHHLGLDMDARLESKVLDSLAHLDSTNRAENKPPGHARGWCFAYR